MLEVTLAAALTLVVFGSVLGLLDSFVTVESRFEDRIDSRTDLNLIIEEFARDVRSAGSPWAGSTSSEMSRSVTIPRLDSAGDVQLVRWSIDAEGTLARTVIEDRGRDSVRVLATGLDSDRSRFTYHDDTGAELVPGTDPADDVSGCATRLGISLVATGDQTFQAETSATLRNAEPDQSC